MGILGGPSYHGNPCCMAADVNNIEEILVNRTEAKTLWCGTSGSFSALLEMIFFCSGDVRRLNLVKTFMTYKQLRDERGCEELPTQLS